MVSAHGFRTAFSCGAGLFAASAPQRAAHAAPVAAAAEAPAPAAADRDAAEAQQLAADEARRIPSVDQLLSGAGANAAASVNNAAADMNSDGPIDGSAPWPPPMPAGALRNMSGRPAVLRIHDAC